MAGIGLDINPTKCEIILPADIDDEQKRCAVGNLHQCIPGADALEDSKQTILGASINEAAAEVVIAKKLEELEHMIKRLHHLDAHTSYLLSNCLWLPKLKYLLRAAPLYRHARLLGQLDTVLLRALDRNSRDRGSNPRAGQKFIELLMLDTSSTA